MDEKKSMDTPVLLIVFNRPNTTKKVFEVLRKVRPSKLYVSADGPRSTIGGEDLLCKEARDIASHPDWECEIRTLFRKENLGCQAAVSGAIEWFFNQVDAGIIIEDDCVPHEDFFEYCSCLLSRFYNDERIMMIAGTNFLAVPKEYPYSYFFSKYYPIWGWATWKRAWTCYQPEMRSWPARRGTYQLEYLLGSKQRADHYKEMFDSVYYNNFDTWDLQWVYSCLFQNSLSIIPKHNLISNIGISGAHAGGDARFMNMKTTGFDVANMIHPVEIFPDSMLNSALFETIAGKDKGMQKWLYNRIRVPAGRAFRICQKLVNRIARKIVAVALKRPQIPRVVRMPPTSAVKNGNALLSYIRSSVLLPDKDRSLEGHSNGWESREIARILTRFGYRTDVIDYGDSGFLPDEKYDLVLDIHGNLQRLAPFLPPRALKLLHMTGSYPGYSNHRELERIDALEKRKGLLYGPKRIVDSILFDRSLKLADACSLIGNEWTRNTYPAQYREKITLVTVSASRLSRVKSPSEYFREGRLDFIWFFGGGAVHKGLDLTLDAFSLEPEFHLHVVGPIEAEPDFVKIYKKELYNTANITFHGYLSPSSIQFEKVIDKCCCFIAPSCSESISTAVATMLQVGLYPIISRDTGITLPKGCGMYLEDLTVEEIRRMVHRVNESAHGTLCEEMRQIQENALAAYSRQAFGERMNYYINAVLMRVGML